MLMPASSDYAAAVQSPENFTDADLRHGSARMRPMGIPWSDGGGFAMTYSIRTETGNWAVRCFHKSIDGLQERYAKISEFLNSHPNNRFVSFDYQPEGIRVLHEKNAKFWPIVKMVWVEGETLGSLVHNGPPEAQTMTRLASEFAALAAELEKAGIAHGDLQHANIMVQPDQSLKLIDYDGMFVPGMVAGSASELGQRNYQHPRRDRSTFGPQMDRFSSLEAFSKTPK